MHLCKFCHSEFPTHDELVDHLTDEHDAFSSVTEIHMEVEG